MAVFGYQKKLLVPRAGMCDARVSQVDLFIHHNLLYLI